MDVVDVDQQDPGERESSELLAVRRLVLPSTGIVAWTLIGPHATTSSLDDNQRLRRELTDLREELALAHGHVRELELDRRVRAR